MSSNQVSRECWNCKAKKESVSEVVLTAPDGGDSPSWLCDDCKELGGVREGTA